MHWYSYEAPYHRLTSEARSRMASPAGFEPASSDRKSDVLDQARRWGRVTCLPIPGIFYFPCISLSHALVWEPLFLFPTPRDTQERKDLCVLLISPDFCCALRAFSLCLSYCQYNICYSWCFVLYRHNTLCQHFLPRRQIAPPILPFYNSCAGSRTWMLKSLV